MDSRTGKKRQRGGLQQRLKKRRLEPETGAIGESSALCMLLLNLFAWGFFSPQRVQQIADLAVKDIERCQDDPRILADLRTLANLGTKGKWSNNMHPELMRRVEHVPQTPQPYQANIPLKGFPNSVQYLLLPHEMFASIWAHYQHVWTTCVAPSVDTVQKFWRSMRLHPQLHQHPMCSTPGWDQTTIPLAVHGDGVPITGIGKVWSKVMTNYSWYSLVGHGHTSSMLMWIWGFFDALKLGDQTAGTLFEFYSILKWSFAALALGQWPTSDHVGQENLSL